MKRPDLKTLEELVLLTVIIQAGHAYGVSIKQALAKEEKRPINISSIHSTLRQLLEKGFVQSKWSEASTERGGHRKRIFNISARGRKALEEARDTKVKLWAQISDFLPKMIQL